MEKELKKKRKEIMSTRRTSNRKLKDGLNSRKQLIVIIRVNGWTNRGRNKKNTKQLKEKQTNQYHINLETDRANRLKQRSNAHARNKRSKVENTYKIQPSMCFVALTTRKFSTFTHQPPCMDPCSLVFFFLGLCAQSKKATQ